MRKVIPVDSVKGGADSLFATSVGGLLLLLSFSRGAFELVVDKTTAYALQLMFIVIWFIWAWFRGWIVKDFMPKSGLIALSVSIVAAFVSTVATTLTTQQFGAIFYFVIYTMICALLCIPRFFNRGRFVSSIVYSVAFSVVSLEVVATFQQLGFLGELPGGSDVYQNFTRPPSLTGSMLHYPIIAALGSILVLDHALRCSDKRMLFISTVCAIGVLASYSRSGILILVVALLWVGFRFSDRKNIGTLLVLITLTILGFGVTAYFSSELVIGYFDRAFTMFDMSDNGNASRLETWLQALSIITSGPIWFSDTAGFYTNATANFNLSSELFVAESSLLLFFLNFGVISGLLFYLSFFLFQRSCKLSIAGFGALIAVMVQSLVYQSFEVLPFVFIFSMTLALARPCRNSQRRVV